MGGLTCGTPLPSIKTTTNQVTSAPQFYTCYLTNLATQGANAANTAQYVGAQPLQTAAFNEAANNIGNYQPTLNAATCLAASAGTANLGEMTQNLMSPYIKNVVCSIGTLGEQNIINNLAPQATAGLVGSGQFGSTRGVGALGQVLANAGENITAQQACALEKGYTQAQCAAEKEIQNELNAGNLLNTISGTTSNLGIQCENALSTLGAQQQTIGQNAQNFPLTQLSNEAALLRGYTIPTSVSSAYCGPIPGAYNASPLSQIAGIGALAAGISCTALGKAIGSGLSGLGTDLSGLLSGNTSTGSSTTDNGGVGANAGAYCICNNPYLNYTGS